MLGPPYKTIDGYPGTHGTNTRGSVSWTGTVPVPTVPGTRHGTGYPVLSQPGCNSNGDGNGGALYKGS